MAKKDYGESCKLRIPQDIKAIIDSEAKLNERTFVQQVRFILREWTKR